MKTNKIILTSLAIGLIALGSSTFAANETKVVNGAKSYISKVHSGVNMGEKMFGGYIDSTKLTADQKAQLKTIVDSHKTKMEGLKKSMVGLTGDALTQAQANFKTQWTSEMQSVRTFVPADKLTAFDAFVAKGPELNKSMKKNVVKKVTEKTKTTAKKQLSKKSTTKIQKKVAKTGVNSTKNK